MRDVRSHSAVLQWRSALVMYELLYWPDLSNGTNNKLTVPGDFSWTELNDLQPDTNYTARLIPETNAPNTKSLSVTFRTLPGEDVWI